MVRYAKPTLPEEINRSMKNPVGIVRNSANRDTCSVADMTDDDETDFSMTKRHQAGVGKVGGCFKKGGITYFHTN